MTSDDTRTAKDVPFKPAGPGLYATFLCIRCHKSRLVLGSRQRRGLRVCGVCVQRGKAA